MKKSRLTLLVFTAFALAACGNDKQAELEQQLKAQQEQIAQLQAQAASAADQTVYQLLPDAVNETLSPEAQQQGKNGEIVTGKDGQQYMYDSSTGSWFLQSLVGAAAGAFIGIIGADPVFVLEGPLPLYRDLNLGDNGDDVLAFQKALNSAGYATAQRRCSSGSGHGHTP